MQTHPLGDKASLSGIRRLIRADLNRAGVDQSYAFDCLVAVTEACTNALLHGMGHEEDPEVSWEIDENRIAFCVTNFSVQPWSSKAAHPSRSTDEIPDAERVGGFGLELMRELMDQVNIQVGPAGTEVRLVKRLPATPRG